eukprot:2507955-Rhodomonas_salina.3
MHACVLLHLIIRRGVFAFHHRNVLDFMWFRKRTQLSRPSHHVPTSKQPHGAQSSRSRIRHVIPSARLADSQHGTNHLVAPGAG